MEPLLPVQVTLELRTVVAAMLRRLEASGTPRLVAADEWRPFADALRSGASEHEVAGSGASEHEVSGVEVVVGPIAATIERLADAAPLGAIGFIAPAAYRRRWWQREPTVFLDPTMEIWRAGWTPIALERIDLAGADSTIEVIVGNARPTPERPVSPR